MTTRRRTAGRRRTSTHRASPRASRKARPRQRPLGGSRRRTARTGRRLDPTAAAERASRLPHHPRYTAALLAQIRQRFETTPEPVPSMAADLGVAPGSLHRIARRHGWIRRNPVPPPHDVSPALRLLEQARALEAASMAAAGAAGPVTDETERAAFPESAADHSPERLGPPGLSTIVRLERAVLAELATIEAMRAAMDTLPQKPVGAARTVRTLNVLTQTLQHLQRLRASAALSEQPIVRNDNDDDDLPADIDEFRRDLARRIDAFVESRTDGGGAGGNADAQAVDRA